MSDIEIIPTEPTEEHEHIPSTAKEQLKEVNMAISAILNGGQHYKIGSRSLTRADLKQLYAIKTDLQAQVAAETETGLFDNCYTAVFDGR